MIYNDLFKTAMELYEHKYPKKYTKNIKLIKEMVCDLSYMSNMSIHEEIVEFLLQDKLFIQCLVTIAITGSSFKETIDNILQPKKPD